MKIDLLTIGICFIAVILLSFIGGQIIARMMRKAEKEKADQFVQEAREKAKEIELEARDSALKIKQEQRIRDQPAQE